ncbi:MAG: aminotransferase class V-fold PLP-dependent enzyme [Clostridia bacterium]|nr:aminotransferase class V-fold PLP-dependent enzyme [Clostridia bacterium]
MKSNSLTPIFDFLKGYAKGDSLRFHMPGHKGIGVLGVEELDLTEINGADSLYLANGIIAKSEENASEIFGCKTYYSTEGSSLAIRAMLYMTLMYAKKHGKEPLILAGRNAHKSFLSAVALLDFEVEWLYPASCQTYLSCLITAKEVEDRLKNASNLPVAVYLTTPDYLGNIIDVQAISRVCKKYGVLLLIDNAHGAYLKFLSPSSFPVELGADACCSSAHKTLPVLTGGAYLHLSKEFENSCQACAKTALSLFGSTSPSYLILASLDAFNKEAKTGYKSQINEFIPFVEDAKIALLAKGFTLIGNEPMKIVIRTKPYGYTGVEIAEILQNKNIVAEFCDNDYIVFMLTPYNGKDGVERLVKAMLEISRRTPISIEPPSLFRPKRAVDIKTAVTSLQEVVKTEDALGRILGFENLFCPPAIPIVCSGEIIDENAIDVLKYYGIERCTVLIK